ncbi:MAG: chemotaxis protein CheW [Thermoanaerobaculia bacterium]
MPVNTLIAEQPQALTFRVAGQEYAIGILNVKEIIEYETPTRVPSAPACVAGVINLRGTVVPVIDLALRFNIAPAAITSRTCIVIVEVDVDRQTTVMGVIADAVSAVIDLTADQIDQPPQFGTLVRSDYLLGLIRSGRKFVLLLDIDRTLAVIDAGSIGDAGPGAVMQVAATQEQ